MNSIPRTITLLAALLTFPLLCACQGRSTDAMTHATGLMNFGPNVRFTNDSDVPLLIRYWVAKVDTFEPSGFTDQRTHPRLRHIIEPGDDINTKAGRFLWTTGDQDAVVWVHIEPVIVDPAGPTTATPPRTTPIGDPIWFELTRPGPYHIIAQGTAYPVQEDPAQDQSTMPVNTLAFVPANKQTGPLVPLPRSMWITKDDGYYAITD